MLQKFDGAELGKLVKEHPGDPKPAMLGFLPKYRALAAQPRVCRPRARSTTSPGSRASTTCASGATSTDSGARPQDSTTCRSCRSSRRALAAWLHRGRHPQDPGREPLGSGELGKEVAIEAARLGSPSARTSWSPSSKRSPRWRVARAFDEARAKAARIVRVVKVVCVEARPVILQRRRSSRRGGAEWHW